MSTFTLFIVAGVIAWLCLLIVLLILALKYAQTSLVQEITSILSNTPSSQKGGDVRMAGVDGWGNPAQPSHPFSDPPGVTRASPGPYQRNLALLGAYLDRHQREFVAIWELANGYLLQIDRPGATETDYLKVTGQQLHSMSASPPSQWEPQGPAVSFLRQIGAHLDQRQARTIQIVVVGQSVVASGLAPRPAGQHNESGQTLVTYVPFQQVFAVPEVA